MRGKTYFTRELQNTYFVEGDCKRDLVESFTGQMILKGNITGIANCTLRLMDGNREISFDISSLASLEQAYSVKKLDYRALRLLFRCITELMEEMEQNLADTNGICFAPEHIYLDTITEKIKFIYDFTEVKDKSSIADLAEYCIERVDNGEEKAVDLAYYFYEHARGDHFSLKEIEEYIEKEKKEKNDKNEKNEKEPAPEPENMDNARGRIINSYSSTEYHESNKTEEENLRGYDYQQEKENDEFRPDWEDYGEPEDSSGMDLKGKNIENGKYPGQFGGIICIAVSVLSFVIYMILSMFYTFNTILETGWMAVSVVIAVVGIVLMFCFNKNRQKEYGFDEDGEYMEEMARRGEESLYLGDNKKTPAQEEELWSEVLNTRGKNEISGYDNYSDAKRKDANIDEERGMDGRTVYVGKEDNPMEHCLVGRHRGREREYPIGDYPWVVGKEKSRVNMQISEPSVSRIHARFLWDEGDIYVEDLASTNGTYINDLPLSPHERFKLKRGDCILFGRSEFVFE